MNRGAVNAVMLCAARWIAVDVAAFASRDWAVDGLAEDEHDDGVRSGGAAENESRGKE